MLSLLWNRRQYCSIGLSNALSVTGQKDIGEDAHRHIVALWQFYDCSIWHRDRAFASDINISLIFGYLELERGVFVAADGVSGIRRGSYPGVLCPIAKDGNPSVPDGETTTNHLDTQCIGGIPL